MKRPTHAQFSGIHGTAIAMGISRDAVTSLIDDGSFATMMRNRMYRIRADEGNFRTFEISAMVNQGRDWTQALEAAVPDTPSDFGVRNVGNLYPATTDEEEEVNFVLLKGNSSWDKALAWAKTKGLKQTNPRDMFAVAEQHDLHQILGGRYLYVVATTECSFEGYSHAVYVDVDESSQHADLGKLEYLGSNDWFLFRK